MDLSESVCSPCASGAPRPRRATSWFLAAAACLLGAPSISYAHHGRDFLLLQTGELPHRGQLFLVSRQDYVTEEKEDGLEWEPAFLFGIADRLTFEAHAHVAKEGDESFTFESISPALHLRLSPAAAAWIVGLFAEYEISEVDEHEDRAEARLSLLRVFRKGRFAVNLIAEEEQEEGADLEWGYAVGWRRAASGAFSWGLELEGSFEEDRGEELLLGLYFEPSPRFTFNLGVGAGLGDNETDLSLRTALIWRAF